MAPSTKDGGIISCFNPFSNRVETRMLSVIEKRKEVLSNSTATNRQTGLANNLRNIVILLTIAQGRVLGNCCCLMYQYCHRLGFLGLRAQLHT